MRHNARLKGPRLVMAFKLIIEWHNAGPHTIWGKLAEKLGREPTTKEAADEVRRILAEATIDRAMAGKLPHQRRVAR